MKKNISSCEFLIAATSPENGCFEIKKNCKQYADIVDRHVAPIQNLPHAKIQATQCWTKSSTLGRGTHGAHVVHQLFVLHEASAAKVAGTSVSLKK